MNGFDPFAACELDCKHDLARGVSIEELLEADGPYLPLDTIRWPIGDAAEMQSENAA